MEMSTENKVQNVDWNGEITIQFCSWIITIQKQKLPLETVETLRIEELPPGAPTLELSKAFRWSFDRVLEVKGWSNLNMSESEGTDDAMTSYFVKIMFIAQNIAGGSVNMISVSD